MEYDETLADLEHRRTRARAGGGAAKMARVKAGGKLNARERIDLLLDPGSFSEIGLLAHSDMPGDAADTPADSKVAGFGKLAGRRIGVVASDFTVKAGTSSRVAARKEHSIAQLCSRNGYPYVYLGEGGGARMPDIMGSVGLATFGGTTADDDTFVRALTRYRDNPMVVAILGDAFGEPTWHACLADFVVMTKGSCMAVSGPRVLEVATGEKLDPEELGGWKVHSGVTGMVDAVAENDAEALDIIKRFLSYLPSNSNERAPRQSVPPNSGVTMPNILDDLPARISKAYNIIPLLERVVDTGSLFEIKPRFGKSLVTALARLNGESVGIIANQPRHLGGALDTDAIDKAVSFLCLCDSFNIPLVFFHDMPGFLVGLEPERKRAAAKIMTFLEALGQVTVPKIAMIIRKSYGMAFYNMGGTGTGSDFIAAWPTAEIGFVADKVGVNVVYGPQLKAAEDPEAERVRLEALMQRGNSPYNVAGNYLVHDIIAPAETRSYLVNCLEIAFNSRTGGIGKHYLRNWPKKF
ncbi:MAG: carboxyl transferase [Chloroflexi bacterium]|nr:carboxyl transferase [Chloroflexota bacterium]OJV96599.1 MAG: carboxyl transferase [Chloroflexi bacterium 54-19]